MVAEVFPILIPWNISSRHLSLARELLCDIPDFLTNLDAHGGCGELCSPIPAALPRWDSHFPFAISHRAQKFPELPMNTWSRAKPFQFLGNPQLHLRHAQGGCSSISCSMEFQQSGIDRSCAQIPVENPWVDPKGFKDVWIYWESSGGNGGVLQMYKTPVGQRREPGGKWGNHNEEDVETTRIQSLENSTLRARGNIPGERKSYGILLIQQHIPTPNPASCQ